MSLSSVLIITVRVNLLSAKICAPRYLRTETVFENKREKTMNTLKSLVAAVTLTFVLFVSAAGQALDCKPGDTQTPPCPSGLVVTSEDPALVPGETRTPPEVQSVEIVSLVELALSLLLLA